MYESINRPWIEPERRRLIRLWPLVPSCALIAIELNRSMRSVQSQASRMGLPRRNNEIEKSRAQWTISEFIKLAHCLTNHIDADNKIHIVNVANEMNRSVDKVIGKLIKFVGDEKKVLSLLYSPLNMHPADRLKAKFCDDRKLAKARKCLTCQKQFWSIGSHNKICEPCKEANQEIESSEHSFV